jgi:large subunit ribosomal protein L7/L12
MATTIEKIVDEISGLTAIELSDLKKALEEKFGVTAAAPVAYGGGAAPAAAAAAPAEEEQTEFTANLVSSGDSKLNVIKVVREITGLGLKEAKDLVDAAPKAIKEAVSRDEAEKVKAAVEAAGGKVEIK